MDHSTDAWDTIDWLVKNVPESNGRVGMIGSSYEGFTVAMALIDPHPALKVAAPESPMVDGWMGDDWFHFGAFRQPNLDYFTGQTTVKGEGAPVPRGDYDDYEAFRRAGSAGDYAKAAGLDQLPFWRKVSEHPAYDAFWQGQALDRILPGRPSNVPTMWVQGLWDQEDMWGAIHCYLALEPKDAGNDRNYLVMGPWRHSGVNYDGSMLGPLKWEGDTALQFRRDVLKPFFDQYLKDGRQEGRHAARLHLQHRREPLGPAPGLAARLRQGLRVAHEGALPAARLRPLLRRARQRRAPAFDEYVSDPGQARSLHSASGAIRRRRRVATVAGQRPAPRGRPPRRADLRHRGPDRAPPHQRGADRQPRSRPRAAPTPTGWSS